MAKGGKKPQGGGKKKQSKASNGMGNNRNGGSGMRRSSPTLEPAARDWLRLVGDPCRGALTSPPYPSTDTGYLIRTVDVFNPVAATIAGGVVGSTIFVDAYAQYSPSNVSVSTGNVVGGTANVGGTFTLTTNGFTNFITSTAAVKRYRPVACCLKFIPSGPYASRAGTIGVSYTPSSALNTGDTTGSTGLVSLAQFTCPVGSQEHEVKWVPTSDDAAFTTVSAPVIQACGSVSVVLRGIDATVISATGYSVNGYFEATTVWEWVPISSQALSTPVRAPMATTVQAILATVPDISTFLTTPLMHTALGMGMRYVTNGYNTASRKGASVPYQAIMR